MARHQGTYRELPGAFAGRTRQTAGGMTSTLRWTLTRLVLTATTADKQPAALPGDPVAGGWTLSALVSLMKLRSARGRRYLASALCVSNLLHVNPA